jgi:hypothetical protein
MNKDRSLLTDAQWARLSPLLPGQESLRCILHGLLRQDYMHDSLYYAPLAAAHSVPTSEKTAPIPWYHSNVITILLLITPHRDSLVNVLIAYSYGRDQSARITTKQDSSYCFRVRAGQPQFISVRRFD